uniref:MYM-type domain-containing protein n=1 Tax=viral metagenome TaxID=1070528 RepID=A0A6C0CXB3_9ZZZZ
MNKTNTKEKKKRGRKPKNNVIVNDNPVFETHNNEYIIKLNSVNIHNNQNIDNIGENDYCHQNSIITNNISELCWNCCEKLNSNNIYGIPIIYKNKIFYTYGDFCSFECGLRYIKDNFDSNKFLEISSYTNLYKKEILNNDDIINIAPHRLLLKKFGGNLSIDEYRSNNIKYGNNILNIPIGTQLYHTFEENKEILDSNNDNSDLRLYRTKTKTNSDIKSILNL